MQGSARSPELTEFVSTGLGAQSDSLTGLINADIKLDRAPCAKDNSERGDEAGWYNVVLYVIWPAKTGCFYLNEYNKICNSTATNQ